MTTLALAGYSVDSDVELPQADPWFCSTAADSTDLRIREATSPLPLGQAAPDQLLLDIPGTASFELSQGHLIRYARHAQADQNDIAIFLTDTVLPLCLQQRGEVVLRAAVVHDGQEATVLVGLGGVGKSALAYALTTQGLTLMCDGFCRIALCDEARPVVFSSGLGLRLRADSFDLLQISERRGARLRPGVDRFFVRQPTPAAGHISLPLKRLYMLEALDPVRSAPPTPAPPLDILRCLHAYAFREALVRTPRQRGHYFAVAAALTRHAQVFTLRCPWGSAKLTEFAQAMAAGLQATSH